MLQPGYDQGPSLAAPGRAAPEEEGRDVASLRTQWLNFSSSKHAELDEQRSARHYYHADQYTSTELEILKKRNQPPITHNVIGRKIDGVVGLVERLRQDPKAFPRTPNQEDGAEIATATIRYALDVNDWQPTSSDVARDASITGISGVELFIEAGDKGDPDIGFNQVDSDTFFYDPRSVRRDFSDARFNGVAKWVDLEVAQDMFKEKATELADLVGGGADGSIQQQDRENRWIDSTLKRVFLIEHWYVHHSEWRFCFYVADVELQRGTSPFFDEKGKTISRYVMLSTNVDHDGDRYGFIRNLKSLQDEINSRRSRALHLLHTRRITMDEGAVQDIEKVRREAVRPDGVVVKNQGYEFEYDDQSKFAEMEGQLKFLEEAKAVVEQFGPNQALIGQGSEQQSGRAIQLLQQAGIAELGPFILSYRGWKLRVYRAIWNAQQRYWTSERWVRVTDNDEFAHMPLNQLQVDPNTGLPTIVNALGSLDVDIILDEGPDTMNVMQDTYDVLQGLANNKVPVPPAIFIKLSQLPSSIKKEILAMLEQPDPMQDITKAQGAANVQKTQAETKKLNTEAAAKVHDILHEVAVGDGGGEAPAPAPAAKGPSESINYNDLPPEAQAAMLAQAGIHISPAALKAHAAEQTKAEQAAMAAKAALRPQPQRQSVGA